MRTRLALLGLALWAAGPSHADPARIAVIPDVQNYVTTIDGGDMAIRAKLLDEMTSDIIAWKPDFAVQVGDLTDSTGGMDQNGMGYLDDDPNSKGLPQDEEWKRIRTQLFDRLDAAKIPHLEVAGNHDSGVDYARWFPADEFKARPWFYAMLSRKPAWKDPIADTTQRAALMPTPIGTICVIGQPFQGASRGTIDTDWLVAQIGCGARRPTVLVQHGGLTQPVTAALAKAPQETKSLVIATVEGHFVCTGCVMMSQFATRGMGLDAIQIRANWQETSLGPPGGTNHTGLSWWAQWTLDPKAGKSILVAHNPHLGTSNAKLDAGYTNQNGPIPLPFKGCERFDCGGQP